MEIIAKLYNPRLNIAVVSWREVYQMPDAYLYKVEYHCGQISYRLNGENKRVSYRQLKSGLVKRTVVVAFALPF